MKIVEDTGLAERLRAAHAVGDRAIARCLELESENEQLRSILKGVVVQMGHGWQLTVTADARECGLPHKLKISDASTFGEKAVRLELVKGQP